MTSPRFHAVKPSEGRSTMQTAQQNGRHPINATSRKAKPQPVLSMPPGTPRYQVESGVPMPKKGKQDIYPWAKMKVGDSFFVPLSDTKYSSLNQLSNLLGSCARGARDHGIFVVRRTEDGIRVWRVK